MKLISYQHDNAVRYGVLLASGVVDMRHCMNDAPASINDFAGLASSQPGLMASIAARAASATALPLAQLQLLPSNPAGCLQALQSR